MTSPLREIPRTKNNKKITWEKYLKHKKDCLRTYLSARIARQKLGPILKKF